jgi:hypothetical protein
MNNLMQGLFFLKLKGIENALSKMLELLLGRIECKKSNFGV